MVCGSCLRRGENWKIKVFDSLFWNTLIHKGSNFKNEICVYVLKITDSFSCNRICGSPSSHSSLYKWRCGILSYHPSHVWTTQSSWFSGQSVSPCDEASQWPIVSLQHIESCFGDILPGTCHLHIHLTPGIHRKFHPSPFLTEGLTAPFQQESKTRRMVFLQQSG